MMTIGDTLRMNVANHPNKNCIADENKKLTYRQFNQRVNQLANGLMGLGLKQGDKIAIYAKNCIEYMEVFHACAKIGVCIVTLNYWLNPNEIVVLFNHSDAVMMILGEEYQQNFLSIRSQLKNIHSNGVIVMGSPLTSEWKAYENVLSPSSDGEPQVIVDLENPCQLMYTSGTTGDPKGVIRSFKRMTLAFCHGLIAFGLNGNDYFLANSPFFHGVTWIPLMVLQVGGSIFVGKEFNPDKALEVIEKENITATLMVPTMIDMVLHSPRLEETCFNSLRMLLSVAAPLPTQVKEAVMRKMGPVLYEWYAASESGFLTILKPEDQLRKIRCCGQPCFGAEVEIRDENGCVLPPGEVGEIFSKCVGRFDEYYKNPEKTGEALKGEWFSAGDLGTRDEENYFYIVDRKTDMIISGGENIYPREIEDILKLHPAVMECVVIGIPDEKWGERVKAMIVVKTGRTVTKEEIINHCNSYLGGFKRPKEVEFVNDFPRTVGGKIKKKVLRDEHWKGMERKV